MDPYVLIKYNKEVRQTRIIEEGGKECYWNEIFDFRKTNQDSTIYIEVMD
jgi:hypothetical protein